MKAIWGFLANPASHQFGISFLSALLTWLKLQHSLIYSRYLPKCLKILEEPQRDHQMAQKDQFQMA